jgi:hypothetical protein
MNKAMNHIKVLTILVLLLVSGLQAQSSGLRCEKGEFSGEARQGQPFRRELVGGIKFSVDPMRLKEDPRWAWFQIRVVGSDQGVVGFNPSDSNWLLAADFWSAFIIRIILARAVPLFKAIVQSVSHRCVLRTRSVRRRAASFSRAIRTQPDCETVPDYPAKWFRTCPAASLTIPNARFQSETRASQRLPLIPPQQSISFVWVCRHVGLCSPFTKPLRRRSP